ncbi:MAG: POTRA domain-containing protein [Bacteroidales bacterium]|jgi:outer membrane protein insertion porin family|nr:POTRA domain-containing protein [Bacteroidales bacterium]HRT00467.1 POTRA domain-containing protein [Bacteroidales bacterium]
MKLKLLFIVAGLYSLSAFSQEIITTNIPNIDYAQPKEYELGGVTISGVQYLDQDVLLYLTGLEIGQKIMIPGEQITKVIKKLYEQGLFSEIKITLTNVINNRAFIDIYLQERPRLSSFSFTGIKKSEADDIRDLIKLIKGVQVTDNTIISAENKIIDYFIDKGFLNIEVSTVQTPDTIMPNSVSLVFNINKNQRVKINNIVFIGNDKIGNEKNIWNSFRNPEARGNAKLKRAMKSTKEKAWYNIFKPSKLIEKDYETDKKNIINKYNELGYRDAKIIKDSIVKINDKLIDIYIFIDEGEKYYFHNITWVGNTKYSSEVLSKVLGIKPGDVYNKKLLEDKLLYDPDGVMSLYQDNGYLFSNIVPVEIAVANDSIDIEMRIYEGKQARINRVTVTGNNRTNDHVILREIRSRPGSLYRRSDVQRTIRELAQLGYFDPEKLNVDFNPDPVDGTVDLEYIVEEKPSDQIELSGGYGAGMIVGTLGLSFNNFSLKNIFNKDAYRPLPSGDGQRLSIRGQASGTWYQNYSFQFIEPWFGGKKPNAFTTSIYHSNMSLGGYSSDTTKNFFKVTGAGLGLGQRLRVPDDYFTFYNEIGYKFYNLKNFSNFIYKDGYSNNLSFKSVIGRNSSGPNPIFPTMGSSFSLSIELTPPYSFFNGKEYTDNMSSQERYKWIEYHKYKLSGLWFTTLAGTKDGSSRALVLMSKFEFGILAMYNRKVGPSPFEGFQLGGDGLYGYNLYGLETIGLRGYANNSLTPAKGGNLYDKFTVELRYPLSLNPTATLYMIGFVEAGNAWYDIQNFNPFDVKRSAGVGVRIYMPMIGMLGVDWGYGFDNIQGSVGQNKSQFHFVIGQQF